MRRVTLALTLACLAAAVLGAAPARAAFGIHSFDVAFTNENGTPATEAGTHPFAMTVALGANTDAEGNPEGRLKDFLAEQISGLVADTTAYPRCTSLEFLEIDEVTGINACPLDTTVGIAASATSEPGLWSIAPLFNLEPPPGVLLRLGFRAGGAVNVVIDAGLDQTPPYNPIAASRNIPEVVDVFGSKLQLWGDPSDPAHDELRGSCGFYQTELPPGEIAAFQFEGQGKSCPVAERPRPFLTLPTSCAEPLRSSFEAFSWAGEKDSGSVLTHDLAGNPISFSECGRLDFGPSISTAPTTRAAQSPSGLDISLEVKDEGLVSVGGRSQSHIRKVVLRLPEGMTANPAVAEGLEVCSEAALERETFASPPGAGCPEGSKLGTVEVESPLIDKTIKGALYQAAPFENRFGTLLAFYFVLKDAELGIIVKQAARVVPDPATGRLEGITEDIPQLPFSHFRLHFREGARSPLVSPPLCGPHTATAQITPWSGTAAVASTSTFELISGPGGGPCPAGGTPPFEPGFQAGSDNNVAGRHSPFSMRLTRRDGDQDLTRFDATLPPGMVATLAGVSQCSSAQIARAKAKSGREELAAPSCPANSRIGSVESGAGVGSQLTYVPGSIYLAGPFGGAPLSVVGIVPAVAGPFDVGTVVVRQALQVNPRSGVVTVDGARSDPIPHILAGIPLVVRDIQVRVDRPGFTLNPTSCDPFATRAQIWGGGANPFSSLDDSPVARQARFQMASCASLGFKPRLSLKLKGGTRRGAFPALRAVLRPRAGDANLENAVVRLPRSAFLEQGHIRTICTRVQYAADACPEGAIYGRVRAFTPILAQPLEGPVYLRSSNNNLPDLVFALRGLVDVEAVGRIDSKRGGIRATFTDVPDAPIDKVVLTMQGGRKGLIVNSTNICLGAHRVNARLTAHNAKRLTLRPPMRASCAKKKKKR